MKAVFTITCPAVLGAGVAGHLIQLVEGRQSLAETAAISFADTRISTPYLFLNPFSTHIAPCSAGGGELGRTRAGADIDVVLGMHAAPSLAMKRHDAVQPALNVPRTNARP